VDKVHKGVSDSSVLYIPVCPVTENNAKYLKRQREAFFNGTPAPDFPGGKGESKHRNRITPDVLSSMIDIEGRRAAGLEKLTPKERDLVGARKVIEQANQILGF
jgi:hypothetical protein